MLSALLCDEGAGVVQPADQRRVGDLQLGKDRLPVLLESDRQVFFSKGPAWRRVAQAELVQLAQEVPLRDLQLAHHQPPVPVQARERSADRLFLDLGKIATRKKEKVSRCLVHA